MQRARFVMVAMAVAVCAAMTWRPNDAQSLATHDTFAERERIRLQAHFDSVDAELRHAVLRGLTITQRARRDTLIAWLWEYRTAGVFPENDRFVTPTPFFVDHRGVRCAMGELLHRSGRDDIVGDVQRTRNNAYIRDLSDDPRLVAWLDSVGLTVAEAGRVQPTYDGGGGNVVDDIIVSPDSRPYRTLAGSMTAASVAAIALNAVRPRGITKFAGLAIGVASVMTGALRPEQNQEETRAWGRASMLTGVVSFGVALARIFPATHTPSSSSVAANPSRTGAVELRPAMVPMADGRQRAGLALHASFR